jgi:hypothetical protein
VTSVPFLRLTPLAAVWQEEIRSAIPGMIKSLKEPNAGVRGRAQNILLILAEIGTSLTHSPLLNQLIQIQAQWCEEIRIAIPRIIDALEESDSAVQDADSNQSQRCEISLDNCTKVQY